MVDGEEVGLAVSGTGAMVPGWVTVAVLDGFVFERGQVMVG